MAMNDYSLADVAAATGNDGFGGNNSWVLILLFAMIYGFGNGGIGGNNAAAASAQDLQRAVDLNSIQTGQANIMGDVQRGIYEVNGATKDAAYNNLGEIRDMQAATASGFATTQQTLSNGFAAMSKCCCETQRAIDGVNYNAAMNTANIAAAIHAEGEATRSMMQQDKIESLQAQVNQLNLNAALCGVVRYPMAWTYNAGNSPFCGNSICCNNAI